MEDKIVKEDKWLRFVISDYKPKTKVYGVVSKCSECVLGIIKWHPQWRHYCFFPSTDIETVHSDRCLLSISEFITGLNIKHKEKDYEEEPEMPYHQKLADLG